MKALTVKQPWAWAIVMGYKDVENKARRTNHRGPVLIHAAKQMDPNGFQLLWELGVYRKLPDELPLGGLVGLVEIVDCVTNADSLGHTQTAGTGCCAGQGNLITHSLQWVVGALYPRGERPRTWPNSSLRPLTQTKDSLEFIPGAWTTSWQPLIPNGYLASRLLSTSYLLDVSDLDAGGPRCLA